MPTPGMWQTSGTTWDVLIGGHCWTAMPSTPRTAPPAARWAPTYVVLLPRLAVLAAAGYALLSSRSVRWHGVCTLGLDLPGTGSALDCASFQLPVRVIRLLPGAQRLPLCCLLSAAAFAGVLQVSTALPADVCLVFCFCQRPSGCMLLHLLAASCCMAARPTAI